MAGRETDGGKAASLAAVLMNLGVVVVHQSYCLADLFSCSLEMALTHQQNRRSFCP